MRKTIYDVYNENCPSRLVLDAISDKWTMLIVGKLSERTCRFGELKREVGGISQKMLTQTLRSLERNGFLLRNNFAVIPPRVEYSLTALGKNLTNVLAAINDWAEQHVGKILEAQKQFDSVCIETTS